MKQFITIETIAKLNPCAKRFDNFKQHYPNYEGDILDFLSLEKITPSDKIWVAIRVLPREILEVFAIDCAFSASEYAANYADAAEYAAEYAATEYAAADAAAERERQVDALIYLIESEGV